MTNLTIILDVTKIYRPAQIRCTNSFADLDRSSTLMPWRGALSVAASVPQTHDTRHHCTT